MAPSNQKSPTSKKWETFNDQESTDYLSSTTNIVEYKNGCQYFHRHLTLIACGFSISKLKNIFNVTLLQFPEYNKEYNWKTAYKTFKDRYDWMTDKFIECICSYIILYIAFLSGTDYKEKYLYAK